MYWSSFLELINRCQLIYSHAALILACRRQTRDPSSLGPRPDPIFQSQRLPWSTFALLGTYSVVSSSHVAAAVFAYPSVIVGYPNDEIRNLVEHCNC